MTIDVWFKIIFAIAGFVLAAIPETIALFRFIHLRKVAKQEAAKEAAKNDMLNVVSQLIENAETLYASIDAALKAKGDSAGSVKKDSVMSKLQAYAITQGYAFDTEFWSAKIDEIVKLTKNVNKR